VVLALWQWVLPRFSSHSFFRRIASQVAVTVLCFAAVMVIAVELHGVLFDAPSMLRAYDGGPVTVTISELTIRRAPYLYALIPVLPIVVMCLVGFNQHWWRMRVLEGRQEELRELAASAQLAALRAQINPHFLFNSLNTIAQLISVDPAKAELCVERLAEIFRYMLTRGEAQFVPLADELNMVEAYLEIERARFGDELVFEERIDEQARRVLLPGLILQPLVENAVKHGVSRKIGGGRVTIEARLEQGDLRLAVCDTGVGVREGAAVFEDGVGLRNVRDRLTRLYGDDYSPEVTSRPGYGTTVSLRIPVAHGSA
jgi:two-component system LytT family sensor kinase